MLNLLNISRSFGPLKALDSISIHIPRGQVIALIGPSGCGKSTLLKLVVGLLQADNGTIHLQGESISPKNIRIMRYKMGYVIQEGGLFPHLTVEKNITLMAKYLKWPLPQIKERLQFLLELSQLPETYLSRFPLQLSGGQRQRVSLMRALMLDPPLLLLDEPLGALDPMIRADLQRDLKQIFGQLKKTVLLVTHDLNEAAFFADRVVLLNKGELVQQGEIVDLWKQPANAFVSQFLEAQTSHLAQITGKKGL